MDQSSTLSADLIGRESDEVVFDVEPGAIRKFADAVGDTTPACVAGEIAPPTFPTTFRMTVPGLSYNLSRILHGSQEYRYERPLRAGDRLRCRTRIMDIYQREGRLGAMTFLILEIEGKDASNEQVFRGKTTAILR